MSPGGRRSRDKLRDRSGARTKGDLTTASHGTAEARESRFVHQETIKLVVLCLVAAAAFLLTRVIAANNREMTLRDGTEWYARGQQQLQRGDLSAAVDSFRKASVRNRTSKQYVLALADALARDRQYEAARRALLSLRESAAENPDINLQLARLAAQQQDVTETLRYYHDTLYAPWGPEQADARRRVRLELIQFLLAHQQTGRALSELMALSIDLPEDAAAHVRAGQLFAEAGDNRSALDQFQRALRLAPANREAMAGAGEAAFTLGDYLTARRYLRAIPDGTDATKNAREIVELVLSRDPLASRLTAAERHRRLLEDVSHVRERLAACAARDGGTPSPSDDTMLQDVDALDARLRKPAAADRDVVEEGFELIYQIEGDVAQRCPPATPLDRALILIGRGHRIE